jgi:hypothetical protein
MKVRWICWACLVVIIPPHTRARQLAEVNMFITKIRCVARNGVHRSMWSRSGHEGQVDMLGLLGRDHPPAHA